MTATEAALLAGVKPVTIHQWVHRGYLTHVDLGEKGPRLYHHLDVARAEKATRAKAKRVLAPAA
ncbi:MerR family transcriptional regulator [Streptomyces sp. NBC_01230]|uniref:MerR family transcriptional regulator n=1 Tax=Streptomyces sp. NBC_01230 TaxID=2903784 RepID=UPI002E11FF8D|nr:MerR family transcriptional regulator [Streptomyces sp. NBC_01230]